MKRYFALALVWLFFANVALAAGPNPPAELSQSSTPTATVQLYIPLVGEHGGDAAPLGQAGSPLINWWLGIGALAVAGAAYAAVRLSGRRKK